MGGVKRVAIVAAVGGAALMPGGASAQYGQSSGDPQPAANVKAEGDPFAGGLAFNPPSVTVKVGQVVRWTNTDQFVPHTATEDHGLWDLAGDYGNTAVAPTGFGPGESRQRVFEAGTQHYYCKVHPQQMKGVVAVPVALAVKKGPKKHGHKTRRVIATWASGLPARDQVFDVQIMRAGGEWKPFRTGTAKTSGKRRTHGKRVLWSLRARLRQESHASKATDWSPVASIKG